MWCGNVCRNVRLWVFSFGRGVGRVGVEVGVNGDSESLWVWEKEILRVLLFGELLDVSTEWSDSTGF